VKSVLIVEANDGVADMFGALFASQEWQVTRYSDGLRASETLGGQGHYDAVLVGYRLEGIDGVELITRIRQLRADMPIPAKEISQAQLYAFVDHANNDAVASCRGVPGLRRVNLTQPV
jgi:CheY-like chemotaxis protein